jgi:hypothetical protein
MGVFKGDRRDLHEEIVDEIVENIENTALDIVIANSADPSDPDTGIVTAPLRIRFGSTDDNTKIQREGVFVLERYDSYMREAHLIPAGIEIEDNDDSYFKMGINLNGMAYLDMSPDFAALFGGHITIDFSEITGDPLDNEGIADLIYAINQKIVDGDTAIQIEVDRLDGKVFILENQILTVLTEVDWLTESKQNKLTAGENIVISDDNVISAIGDIDTIVYHDDTLSGEGTEEYPLYVTDTAVHHDETLTGDGSEESPLSVISGGDDNLKVDKVSFEYDLDNLDFDLYEIVMDESGSPGPSPAEAEWGDIVGDIEDQLDLVEYIDGHGGSGRVIDCGIKTFEDDEYFAAMKEYFFSKGMKANTIGALYTTAKSIGVNDTNNYGFAHVLFNATGTGMTYTFSDRSTGTIYSIGGYYSSNTMKPGAYNSSIPRKFRNAANPSPLNGVYFNQILDLNKGEATIVNGRGYTSTGYPADSPANFTITAVRESALTTDEVFLTAVDNDTHETYVASLFFDATTELPEWTKLTVPIATGDAVGGIKANPINEGDTVPVHINSQGYLYVAPAGGGSGLQEVSHDTTLTGDGTPSDPLSVVPHEDLVTSVNGEIGDVELDAHGIKMTNGMSQTVFTAVEGAYTEIDTKQDALTAGDNITITNNVISATGGEDDLLREKNVEKSGGQTKLLADITEALITKARADELYGGGTYGDFDDYYGSISMGTDYIVVILQNDHSPESDSPIWLAAVNNEVGVPNYVDGIYELAEFGLVNKTAYIVENADVYDILAMTTSTDNRPDGGVDLNNIVKMVENKIWSEVYKYPFQSLTVDAPLDALYYDLGEVLSAVVWGGESGRDAVLDTIYTYGNDTNPLVATQITAGEDVVDPDDGETYYTLNMTVWDEWGEGEIEVMHNAYISRSTYMAKGINAPFDATMKCYILARKNRSGLMQEETNPENFRQGFIKQDYSAETLFKDINGNSEYDTNQLPWWRNELAQAMEEAGQPASSVSDMLDYLYANSGGGGGGDVSSVNGKTGAVVLDGTDIKVQNIPGANTIAQSLIGLDQQVSAIDDHIYELDSQKQDKLTAGSGIALDDDTDIISIDTNILESIDEKVDKTSFDFEEGKVNFDDYDVFMTAESEDNNFAHKFEYVGKNYPATATLDYEDLPIDEFDFSNIVGYDQEWFYNRTNVWVAIGLQAGHNYEDYTGVFLGSMELYTEGISAGVITQVGTENVRFIFKVDEATHTLVWEDSWNYEQFHWNVDTKKLTIDPEDGFYVVQTMIDGDAAFEKQTLENIWLSDTTDKTYDLIHVYEDMVRNAGIAGVEANELRETKQDKLIAGEGIKIYNNQISATGEAVYNGDLNDLQEDGVYIIGYGADNKPYDVMVKLLGTTHYVEEYFEGKVFKLNVINMQDEDMSEDFGIIQFASVLGSVVMREGGSKGGPIMWSDWYLIRTLTPDLVSNSDTIYWDKNEESGYITPYAEIKHFSNYMPNQITGNLAANVCGESAGNVATVIGSGGSANGFPTYNAAKFTITIARTTDVWNLTATSHSTGQVYYGEMPLTATTGFPQWQSNVEYGLYPGMFSDGTGRLIGGVPYQSGRVVSANCILRLNATNPGDTIVTLTQIQGTRDYAFGTLSNGEFITGCRLDGMNLVADRIVPAGDYRLSLDYIII